MGQRQPRIAQMELILRFQEGAFSVKTVLFGAQDFQDALPAALRIAFIIVVALVLRWVLLAILKRAVARSAEAATRRGGTASGAPRTRTPAFSGEAHAAS